MTDARERWREITQISREWLIDMLRQRAQSHDDMIGEQAGISLTYRAAADLLEAEAREKDGG